MKGNSIIRKGGKVYVTGYLAGYFCRIVRH